ncbi:MAG: metallophosphoesterase [Clostridium sp.]|nr:metallophosphoesterase [Clostridium sp.]
MSTVAQDVQQIREAIYGREIREAIADGIEHCYSDVSSGVTTANTAAAAADVAAQRANTAAAGAEGIPGTASLRDVNDLKSAVKNQTVYTMDYLDGDSTLPLIAGKSSGGATAARRMTTDYIPITKDFEVFLDEDEDVVSFNIELYDASLNFIADAIPNYKTRIKKIIFCRSYYSTAKYMKIWVCDWDDDMVDLTVEQYEYAKQHIIIRPYITVKKASEYSPNDFRQGRSEVDHAVMIDQSVYSRAVTDVFYENTTESWPIYNGRNDLVRFYLKYYDSAFNHVEDGEWMINGEPVKQKNHPYFKICISKSEGHDTETITTETARQLGQYLHLGNGLVKNHTISGSTGEFSYVNGIRTCESRRVYVKDAYIKFLDRNYCYDLSAFTSLSGPPSEDYSWYAYSTDFGTTDKAIRIRDRYISVIFAKLDRTSKFSEAEWEEINTKWYAGTLYKVVESIDKNALGEEIDNGYPLYYDAEMKTTVNTACSKIGHNPVKFAMITDLHDNDLWHFSETVEKQIMAIRDLHRKNGLDFVICGGDLTDGGYSNKQQLLDKFTELTKRFKRIGVPVMIIRGNHDDNSYAGLTPERVVTRAEFYARCIAPFAGKTISPDKTYYYQDFDSVNTRIVCLDFVDYPWVIENGQVKYHAVGDSGVWRGYSDDQIVWLLTEALNCDRRIIVTSHYSTHANLMTAWEKSTDHNYTAVNQAMIAYNGRGSVTFGGQTYSFANRTGKILCQVSGHSHSFGAFKDNGIVWSSTGSPSPEVTMRTFDDTSYETMGSRSYGDITEAHFNMFVCDDSNVHIISFGQMGDLDFTV